jgi:hypothetical protein
MLRFIAILDHPYQVSLCPTYELFCWTCLTVHLAPSLKRNPKLPPFLPHFSWNGYKNLALLTLWIYPYPHPPLFLPLTNSCPEIWPHLNMLMVNVIGYEICGLNSYEDMHCGHWCQACRNYGVTVWYQISEKYSAYMRPLKLTVERSFETLLRTKDGSVNR